VTLDEVLGITLRAADLLLEHYEAGRDSASNKADGSPVTSADRAVDSFLQAELGRLGVPVISEESPFPSEAERSGWSRFFLVDPLDGTRDYLARSDEFTINVALVEASVPLLGIVAAPAKRTVWYAERGKGSFSRRAAGVTPIRCRGQQGQLVGLKSRFHSTPESDAFLADHGVARVETCGAAMKLARIAEGSADVYPCFHPSHEWDTAAGQLILEEASGRIVSWPDRKPLRYAKPRGLNPPYLAATEVFFRFLQT
jgi:3'(2'), 5'-bisphosphate nucleotidase